MNISTIEKVLDERFHGVITAGAHEMNGQCCVLELASVIRGLEWTDDPKVVRCFDLRPLNDIAVPDALRTEWMTKLLAAYDGSLDWPADRQQRAVEYIAIQTVRRIVGGVGDGGGEGGGLCYGLHDLS